uniref:translation initiation factor IF-2-like n=1 Tax=Nyctereutes procyonoides TaxID=34880 RepID=UPI002443BD98|nr:translation initiation factor IF-2-like [Nyctereutes procyonoides]
MEAPGGDAAPAGFCKGKSVGRAPHALPQPAAGGGSASRQGAGGLRLGLSLSHFLLLWVLPLPPLTHPLRPPAPHAAPRGPGVPEWNRVSRGKHRVSRQRPARGRRAAAGSARCPDPAWPRAGRGAGGPGGASVRIRWPGLTPARRSRGRGRPAPGRRGPRTALRAAPPAPPRQAAARAPLLGPGPTRTGPQTRDPRGPGQGDSAPSLLGGAPGRAVAGLGARGAGPRARAAGGGAGRRDPAGGGPRARTPSSAPGLARRMQAPSPARPRVSPGPRPGPRGGGRSPGDASGAWRARARAPAAASGPRAAAAATALSRRRPRRPPPRARPLAPPRPEPPPGPRRRRRPPLRFVFPSLAVPSFVCPAAPTPRSGTRAAPAGRPVGPLQTEAGGVGSRSGAHASGGGGASCPPGCPRALRGDSPAGAAGPGIPRPLRPRSPPAARGRPEAGTRSRHARLRGAAPRGGHLAAPVPSAATPQTGAPGGCKARPLRRSRACTAVTRFSKGSCSDAGKRGPHPLEEHQEQAAPAAGTVEPPPLPRTGLQGGGGDLPAATTGTAAWARRMNGPDRKVKKAVQKESKQADDGVEKRELEV